MALVPLHQQRRRQTLLVAEESPNLYAGPVHFSIPIPSVTTTGFIHTGATGHTREPPVKTSSTQNLPNMKGSSIRLVQATPVPKLIWLPPVVQTGETRMPAPAAVAPKRRSVALRHQTLIYGITLAMAVAVAAVVGFWKSRRSSHQSPLLLRTQNSSLSPSLLVDNDPPQIIVIWWLLGSLLSPLQLSCCVDLSYFWSLLFCCLCNASCALA